jgi:hypothetical protein
MAATELNPVVRLRATVYDNWTRVRRRTIDKSADLELRNLAVIEKAYSGPDGPEVLLIGDSAMVWTSRLDTDRRHLVQMLGEAIGDARMVSVVGAGYNPRLVMTYLRAVERCRSRPKVMIVPTTVVEAMDVWRLHPQFGYERKSAEILDLVESGAARPKKASEPTDEEWEAYDRLPTQSLIGARRTMGEFRLLTKAVPTTKWQHLVRRRHTYDMYTAQVLNRDDPGVMVVEEMGRAITQARIHSVALLHPIDVDMCVRLLGPAAKERIEQNVANVRDAFCTGAGDLGRMVDLAYACPSDQYTDALHLNEAGRHLLAERLGEALRAALADAG